MWGDAADTFSEDAPLSALLLAASPPRLVRALPAPPPAGKPATQPPPPPAGKAATPARTAKANAPLEDEIGAATKSDIERAGGQPLYE